MMRRLGLTIAIGITACGWLALAEQPRPGQASGGGRGASPRKRVLAWADTRNGQAQHESTGHALAVIERLGYESGMWDTFIRTDSNVIAKSPKKTDGTPASGGPSLGNVDAIFFMGHREVALDAAQKEELVQFVREGHGFVAAHVGLTAFESWPEFVELIGARFDGHPITGDGVVINESPNFPATKHFPGAFAFNDEFYQASLFSRDKIDVLLRLDVKPGDTRVHADGDHPLVSRLDRRRSGAASPQRQRRRSCDRARTRPRRGTIGSPNRTRPRSGNQATQSRQIRSSRS